MGVPGFYRWVIQRYPLVRHRMNDPARPKIDYFYIDFNCIIYNAIRLINLNSGDYMKALFNEVCRYLDVLVQTVRPQAFLYIAVDGPAPFAKCAQQRSRRFVAARDHKGGGFDTTSISVGTEFMENMHEHLLSFFKNKIASDHAWGKPKFLYSSHRTPGEGEHKFFEFFRKYPDPEATHCVYSPDADLIFLGLMTGAPYFYIMREYDAWIGPNENVGNGKLNKLRTGAADFELLHLPILREYLQFDFPGVEIDNLIVDFNAFSFLLGNDFIPHFPDIIIQQGDFESVVEAYRTTLLSRGIRLVVDGKFNKPALKEFLKMVVSILKKGKGGKKDSKPKINKGDPLMKGRKYLAEKYPAESKDPDFERRLCHAVLDSFDWVLQYYMKGCPSWTWCFSFFYAPPLSVVAEHIDTHESHFELDRPPLPLEQLLCILPPQSSSLLPAPLRALMHAPSPIAAFYPESFKVDLNGRQYEHEGVVLIPFVDVVRVREQVALHAPALTAEQAKRNSIAAAQYMVLPDFVPFDDSVAIAVTKAAQTGPPGEGVPSFARPKLPLRATRERVPINVFSRPSDRDSILLALDAAAFRAPISYRANAALLGHTVMVDWPFLRPALVVAAMSQEEGGRAVEIDASGDVRTTRCNDAKISDAQYRYRAQRGLDVSQCKLWLGVRLMTIANIAETRYIFENKVSLVPWDFVVPLTKETISSRYELVPPPALSPQAPVVVFNGQYSGRRGIVREVRGETALVQLYSQAEPDVSEILRSEAKEWIKFGALCNEYRIDSGVLVKVLSSIAIRGREEDAALTLMHGRTVLEGFARRAKDGLEITRRAKTAIDEYFRYCDRLKDTLQNIDDSDRLKKLDLDEVFSGPQKTQIAKFNELQTFLRTAAPSSKAFLIDQAIITVAQDSLERVETALIGFKKPGETLEDAVEIRVADLVWKGKQKPTVQVASMYCRTRSIAECGPIPFGTAGTVVGIDAEKRELHIIADEELEFGTNLRKRLKTTRGFVSKLDDLWVREKTK